jgi:hypothetical protein
MRVTGATVREIAEAWGRLEYLTERLATITADAGVDANRSHRLDRQLVRMREDIDELMVRITKLEVTRWEREAERSRRARLSQLS